MRRAHLAIFGGVLLAASGLAVLAARSLGAQRVVIEQAAAENARRAATAAAAEWRARLDDAARPCLEAIPESGSAAQLAAALARLEAREDVAAAFALDRNGRLTWPPPPAPVRGFFEGFPADADARAALARGYRAEFVDSDTAAALREYEAAGQPVYGQSVRVEAKLQEAALAAKLGMADRAIRAYDVALAMSRFTEPERAVAAWLERARLRREANAAEGEADALALAASLSGSDAARYGTAAEPARAKVASALAAWSFSAPGRARWDGIAAQWERERAAADSRERAAGLAAALVRQKDAPVFAALDGGLLAAWRTRPGGAAAGVVLRRARLSLRGPGELVPPGGDAAPVPGADGLAVALPPSGEAAATIRRQRLLYAAGLAVLLAALAAGLWASFRAVRREAELARLKGDFVAQVSHELKTPLALVRMYAETLESGKIADEGQKAEYMRVILRESERLSAMIEKILDFARLERGERTVDRRAGDLSEAARAAAAAFTKLSGVPVAVDAPSPVRAAFDPDGVALALRNLLENAAKYSEGTPQVGVRVSERNGTASVAVEDRGIGVAPDDRERVFERFFRAADPRARRTKGTGLGLALVARVMQGHGGSARCEPRQGGGSRFILEFPRSTDAADHPGR